MSGDIYNCDKCGESIHTSCDCGFPSNATMEKENLELRALVSDARSWVLYNLKCALNESEEISAEAWLKKAEKYKQGDEFIV